MNPRREASGRISIHQEGLGTVTQKMIEDRARELALIEGRSRVTNEDRLAARQELLGTSKNLDPLEEIEDRLDSLDPSEIPADHGRQAPEFETDDEQAMVRDIVEYGVNEAEHEQMLEGHRRDEDSDLELGDEEDRRSA